MKKYFLFLLAFLVLFSIVPTSQAEIVEFPDVKLYKEEITFLTERKIIQGYPNGTFGPQNSLTRLQAIQILLKAKGITDLTAANPGMTDMTPGKYGYDEIAKAVELGIISGKTAKDGTKYFDPSSRLTRGQMAKIIVEADSLPISRNTIFSDVPRTNGFHDYISTLAAERITGGYEDGTYKPGHTVSREHFAVFVARMLNDNFKPTTVNTGPSFILDKSKTYTWEYYDGGGVIVSTSSYSNQEFEGISEGGLWRETTSDGIGYFLVMENMSGLYETHCVDIEKINCYGSTYTSLEYPVYEGLQWGSLNNESDSAIYTIVSTNRTVSTRAGIFNNVVEVKVTDGWVYYYAPNVGLVKTLDNGIPFSELVKLE